MFDISRQNFPSVINYANACIFPSKQIKFVCKMFKLVIVKLTYLQNDLRFIWSREKVFFSLRMLISDTIWTRQALICKSEIVEWLKMNLSRKLERKWENKKFRPNKISYYNLSEQRRALIFTCTFFSRISFMKIELQIHTRYNFWSYRSKT